MKMLEVNERGEIIGLLTISDPKGDTQRWYRENKRVVEYEHVSPSEYYVTDRSVVTERPILEPEITSGSGGFCISGLPVPSTVTVDGTEYTVDDGVFEFETPIRSTFKVTIDSWPYRTWRGEVTT